MRTHLDIFNILLCQIYYLSLQKLNSIITLFLFYAHLFPYLEAVSGDRNSPTCFANLLVEMVGSTFAIK